MTARWLAYLSQYDFRIVHRPGKLHGNADVLSRMPKGTKSNCVREDCADCIHIPIKPKANCYVTNNSQDATEVLIALPIWTNGAKSEWQRQDPDTLPVMNWKESGHKPEKSEILSYSAATKTLWAQYDSLELIEGVLYRRFEKVGSDQYLLQYVCPLSQRRTLLKYIHGNKNIGAHQGQYRISALIQERLYWPRWRKDVHNWIRKCDVCARSKRNYDGARARLKQQINGSVLERLGMDIVGPFETTPRGNTYLLTVIDYFTKWADAYPIPDHTAPTVATVLVEKFFTLFGVPHTIHSDQGTEFMSNLMTEIWKLLGVERTRTSGFAPHSAGEIERFNGTLQTLLKAYVNAQRDSWDILIPYVTSAYRMTPQRSTGLTPNFLMLGKEINNPIDVVLNHNTSQEEVCPHYYAQDLKETMQQAFQYARIHLGKAAERQKRNYDLRTKPICYNEGDWVWYFYTPLKKTKLASPWLGPFKITKKINDVVVQIQRNSRAAAKIVHVDKLKKYHGDDPPIWTVPDDTIIDHEELMDPISDDDDLPLEEEIPIIPRKTLREGWIPQQQTTKSGRTTVIPEKLRQPSNTILRPAIPMSWKDNLEPINEEISLDKSINDNINSPKITELSSEGEVSIADIGPDLSDYESDREELLTTPIEIPNTEPPKQISPLPIEDTHDSSPPQNEPPIANKDNHEISPKISDVKPPSPQPSTSKQDWGGCSHKYGNRGETRRGRKVILPSRFRK